LPINYSVVFSEPVTGFDSADISFSGSSIITSGANVVVTGSGTTYNVAVSNLSSNGGVLRASVRYGAATDGVGNLSIASSSSDNSVTFDNVAPTVTINQAIGQGDPTSNQPVNFTAVFSELVSAPDAAHVSLAGSTANVDFAQINVSGSGSVYTISVSNIRSSGLVRVSLLSGASSDLRGNASVASSSSDNSVMVNVPGAFDFDGDGKTDISIFRPTGASGGAEWWYLRSSDGQAHASQFGTSTDQVVAADFTGDGKTDIAVWRPSTGQWFIVRSEDGSFYAFPFGAAGDEPVSADYDGDGKADIGVFRPNGASGGAEWWIQRTTLGTLALQLGASTDKAVPGDYTGDGKTDIAFYRPSNGQWFVLRSEDFSYFAFPFGTTGDIPVPGDYDGDGKSDAAVFRPSASTWFVNRSSGGTTIQQFATPTDMPVANAYVR